MGCWVDLCKGGVIRGPCLVKVNGNARLPSPEAFHLFSQIKSDDIKVQESMVVIPRY